MIKFDPTVAGTINGWRLAVLVPIVIATVALAIAGFWTPPIGEALAKKHRLECILNLQQFATVLAQYAADHGGQFPDHGLWQLAAADYLPAGRVYRCPGPPVTPEELNWQYRRTTETLKRDGCSYVYLGRGRRATASDPKLTPLIADKTDNHDGDWINVLFVDGHIESFRIIDWPVHQRALLARHGTP